MLTGFSSIKSFPFFTVILSACFIAGHDETSTAECLLQFPISEVIIEREAYMLAYDGRNKQARWVYEVLTSANIEGNTTRNKFSFQEDPLIPAQIRSTKEDYAKSAFDQGHLCPAADAKRSGDLMKETFYLSNISPQHPQFNRGYWAKLERYVRGLVKQHNSIHVFTGGLYLSYKESDGKRYVKYQVIGKNDVAVPTHFFKVILGNDGVPLESFILPNESIPAETPLKNFMTTIEKVEKVSGIIFPKN